MRKQLGTGESHTYPDESEAGLLQPHSSEVHQSSRPVRGTPSGAASSQQLRLMVLHELFQLSRAHFLVLIFSALILLR